MIIWNCTVIHRDIDPGSLPPGCDLPMRQAVEAAFSSLTGCEAEALSSGWGQDYLPEHDIAALEGRIPTKGFYECWKIAEAALASLDVPEGDDFTPTHSRYMAALSALAEALYGPHSGRTD